MTKPQSPLNPRDFVELIDSLIMLRIMYANNGKDDERIKIAKRMLTDYLLDIDKRKEV